MKREKKESIARIVKWPKNRTCSVCGKMYKTVESLKKHEQFIEGIWHGIDRMGYRINCGNCDHRIDGTCEKKKIKVNERDGCFLHER